MTHRQQLLILALIIALLLVFALFPRQAGADAPVGATAVPAGEFVPVGSAGPPRSSGQTIATPGAPFQVRTPSPLDGNRASDVVLAPANVAPIASPSASSVPSATPVSRHPVGRQSASSGVTPATGPTAPSVTGTASWYCGHGSACTRGYPAAGMYAAAGPALRVGDWRGRVVTVTAGSRSVRVTLVDFCACPGRLVDLYAAAFSRLAPISQGIVKVSVTK